MLRVLHAVVSVINSVLHLVAVTLVTGGTLLLGATVVLLVVALILALSGTGLFAASSKRNRTKPPS